MSKILTTSQKTFVDIYDSYNLSVTPDVVSVLCNKNGIVEYGTSFQLDYTVKIGDVQIDAKCSVDETALPNGVLIDTTTDGFVVLTVEQNALIGVNTNTTIKLTITTQNNAQITFDHYITIIGVQSSSAARTFKIYSPAGNTFTENIETITLNTVLLDEQKTIEGNSYEWSYYDNATKKWIVINEVTVGHLDVIRHSKYSASTIRCVVTYNNVEYSDYFTLQQQTVTYDAVARLLDYNSSYDDPNVVLVYIDLYKNNVLEETIRTKEWYAGESVEKNGIIETDIENYRPNFFYTDDEVYFVCSSNNNYNVLLGAKINNSVDWKVQDIENQYAYVNDVNGNTTSNVIAIPKSEISGKKEINVSVYKTIYDENNVAVPDSDMILCRVNFSLETALLTQNASQYFSFDKSTGLKIGQKDEKFYTQISSTEMGFYDNTNNNAKKVVTISKESATIKNMKVEESAQFDCNTIFNEEVQFGNFVWKTESNGSLSLAIIRKE